MTFDLRLPVGLMFSLFGLILTVQGAIGGTQLTSKSLGINIDLGWGLVMLAFGLVMLVLALRARPKRK